eukprot:9490630-Pyramimonas_sp.AAC.2
MPLLRPSNDLSFSPYLGSAQKGSYSVSSRAGQCKAPRAFPPASAPRFPQWRSFSLALLISF